MNKTNENETIPFLDKYTGSIQKSYYDLKDGTLIEKIKNGTINNILIITIIILLIIFTIFTNEFNKLNYYGLQNFNKDFAISSILVGFLALTLSIIYLFKYKFQTDNPNIKEEYIFLKMNMKNPIFIAISIYIAFLIFRFGNKLMDDYKTASSIFVTFLLFSMIIGFVALIIYYLNIYKDQGLNSENDYQEPDPNESWAKFISRNFFNIFNLIKNILFYIPCLLIDFAKFIHKDYQITPSPVYVILLIEVIIVTILFAMPYITKLVLTFLTHDSKDLIEDPIDLDRETQLGTFQDLNVHEETNEENINNIPNIPNNDFAISSWIFLNDQTGDNKYYNVFNYGDKPKISYNPKTNKLKFEIVAFDPSYNNVANNQNDDAKNEITQVHEVQSISLQRWNHIVINFTGTHIDIFINNELVFTVNNVIPYLSNDPVFAGDQDGVYGGICNTQYFSRYLNKTSIGLMYNSLQYINPPLL